MNKKNSAFAGFSKLNRDERIQQLVELNLIGENELACLQPNYTPSIQFAENLIENFICFYPLPLGIAVNFNIDQKDYIIPMSVEETSVIAAASKTAKWIQECGEITTENHGNLSIGQIQIPKVNNYEKFKAIIEQNKQKLIEDANEHVAKNMSRRGGGIKDISIRRLARDDQNDMAIIHILVNTCDALGANLINQLCEYLKNPIQNLTHEKINLCILSNLSDTKLTSAKVIIHDIDPQLGEAIEEASLFAQLDPYRAATNNKGALNGMDAVSVATGNDWRALEAGVHAYAARDGQYRSITHWKMQDQSLIGSLEAPINIGTVGGVTSIHPIAALSFKILGINKAEELSRIIAAVGLVQNLGAIRALTTEGIVKGHMKLHIANLCLMAGAEPHEIEQLKSAMQKQLHTNKHISLSDVNQLLVAMRKNLTKE